MIIIPCTYYVNSVIRTLVTNQSMWDTQGYSFSSFFFCLFIFLSKWELNQNDWLIAFFFLSRPPAENWPLRFSRKVKSDTVQSCSSNGNVRRRSVLVLPCCSRTVSMSFEGHGFDGSDFLSDPTRSESVTGCASSTCEIKVEVVAAYGQHREESKRIFNRYHP